MNSEPYRKFGACKPIAVPCSVQSGQCKGVGAGIFLNILQRRHYFVLKMAIFTPYLTLPFPPPLEKIKYTKNMSYHRLKIDKNIGTNISHVFAVVSMLLLG